MSHIQGHHVCMQVSSFLHKAESTLPVDHAHKDFALLSFFMQ